MTKKPKIWLDCDGVLLDWCRPFIHYCHAHQEHLQYEHIEDYYFSNFYNSVEDFIADIKWFNSMPMYGDLPPLASVDLLKGLSKFYDLCVITQIEEPNEGIQEARMLNLERNFPGLFNSVTFTYRGECKLSRILELQQEGEIIIIEDNPSFLQKASDVILHGEEFPLVVFGILHPYNQEIKKLPYIAHVSHIDEAAKILVRAGELKSKRLTA